LQLAYSNAQALVDIPTSRQMIIDSSIFGMGRGAGNLNTELFVEFLNDFFGPKYEIPPLLQVMDQALNSIYYSNYWGYSLPHYLSAIHNCHPNYASYLDDKKTLTVENLGAILSLLPPEKKSSYDKKAIETLYRSFMSRKAEDGIARQAVEEKLKGKRILVIGPGKSSEQEKDLICKCAAQPDVVTVSVNFAYPHYCVDYIFLSNLRRARSLGEADRGKTIVTSNICGKDYLMQVEYEMLLNEYEHVSDNACLMLVKYLKLLGVAEIMLAGIDGYSYDVSQNYAEDSMAMQASKRAMDAMNKGMSEVLHTYSREVAIGFLTAQKNVRIE
jgi:4-hydroxy 2-oxovalerate aldolase